MKFPIEMAGHLYNRNGATAQPVIIRQKRIMCNKKMIIVPVVAVVGTVVVAVVGESVVNVVGVLVLSTTPHTQASS